MLRAVADQPTFWERFLPKELRRLSMELGVSKKDGLAWWYPTPDHRPGGVSAADRPAPPQLVAGRRGDRTQQVEDASLVVRARGRHGKQSLTLALNLTGEPLALTISGEVLEAEPAVADRAVAPHGWAVAE